MLGVCRVFLHGPGSGGDRGIYPSIFRWALGSWKELRRLNFLLAPKMLVQSQLGPARTVKTPIQGPLGASLDVLGVSKTCQKLYKFTKSLCFCNFGRLMRLTAFEAPNVRQRGASRLSEKLVQRQLGVIRLSKTLIQG